MSDNLITLYPSNWLYNAGVIGFLRVLEKCGVNVENFLRDDGTAEIENKILEREIKETIELDEFKIPKLAYIYLILSFDLLINNKENMTTDGKKIEKVWGKLFNVFYRGFFNADTRYLYKHSKNKKSKPGIEQFSDFLTYMTNGKYNQICSFCLTSKNNFSYKNKFTSEHNKILGASFGTVPNSFWNLEKKTSLNICDFCDFVLLNQHIGITLLADYSEIFINASSFKLMWYLNKSVRVLYEKGTSSTVKEILGISLFELASKLYIQLGKWEKMNIEVVSKYREKKDRKWEDKIDFFSLPFSVVDLLTDKEINNILHQIGEFKILNMILDEKFKDVLQFGERVLKISLKPKNEIGKQERDFITQEIKLEKNRENLREFSYKLFQLYALIETKLREEVRI